MATVNDSSCPCGEDNAKFTCGGCKNIKYCSTECQQADWWSHKLLCKSFEDFLVRPNPDMRRLITFSPEDIKPKFMWREIKDDRGRQTKEPDEFLKTAELGSRQILYNSLTGKYLKYHIEVRYDAAFMFKYNKPNQCIVQTTYGRLSRTFQWRGPVLVECLGSDMDTRSFWDVVAYFTDYWNDTPEHKGRKKRNKVIVVKSNCVGEQRMSSVPPFVSVKVPAYHPMFDTDYCLSPISAKLGMPLQTARYLDVARIKRVDSCGTQNVAVTMMHCQPDPDVESDPANDKTSFGWAPPSWQNDVGNVLIARSDRKALKVDTAAAFAAYCQFHLPQYFQWEMESEEALGGGSYRQAAVDEITPEKWANYLKQWSDEKKRRAQGLQKDDGLEELTLAVGRMALTAKDGQKLENRLFGFTDDQPGLAHENDELIGATVDGDSDGEGVEDSDNDSDEENE